MVTASCHSGLTSKWRVVGSLLWPRPSHHNTTDQEIWRRTGWRTKCGVWEKEAQQRICCANPESVNAPETSGVNSEQDRYLHRTGAIHSKRRFARKNHHGCFLQQLEPLGEKPTEPNNPRKICFQCSKSASQQPTSSSSAGRPPPSYSRAATVYFCLPVGFQEVSEMEMRRQHLTLTLPLGQRQQWYMSASSSRYCK